MVPRLGEPVVHLDVVLLKHLHLCGVGLLVLHEPVHLHGVVLLVLGVVLLVLHVVVHSIVPLVRFVFVVSCSPGC